MSVFHSALINPFWRGPVLSYSVASSQLSVLDCLKLLQRHDGTGLPGHCWWPGSWGGLCASHIAFHIWDLSNFPILLWNFIPGKWKNWSQFHVARETHCSPLHSWYLQNKQSLFYWRASLGLKLALGLLLVLWLIGSKDSKSVWELQLFLMQGELFLGQDIIVHFHLTAGGMEFFLLFLLCLFCSFRQALTNGLLEWFLHCLVKPHWSVIWAALVPCVQCHSLV